MKNNEVTLSFTSGDGKKERTFIRSARKSENNGRKVRNTLKVLALRSRGMKMDDIASTIGVSKRSMYRYLEEIKAVEKWLANLYKNQ